MAKHAVKEQWRAHDADTLETVRRELGYWIDRLRTHPGRNTCDDAAYGLADIREKLKDVTVVRDDDKPKAPKEPAGRPVGNPYRGGSIYETRSPRWHDYDYTSGPWVISSASSQWYDWGGVPIEQGAGELVPVAVPDNDGVQGPADVGAAPADGEASEEG